MMRDKLLAALREPDRARRVAMLASLGEIDIHEVQRLQAGALAELGDGQVRTKMPGADLSAWPLTNHSRREPMQGPEVVDHGERIDVACRRLGLTEGQLRAEIAKGRVACFEMFGSAYVNSRDAEHVVDSARALAHAASQRPKGIDDQAWKFSQQLGLTAEDWAEYGKGI